MIRRLSALAIAAVLALAAPGAALAQDCPRTSLADIEDEVMCPRCERPLNTVDREPQAQRQRAFITRLVDECKSKDEVKAALVAQFGEDVLAVPDSEGFDATAFIVPVVAPLLALGTIGYAAVRWRRRRPDAPVAAGGPSMDDADAARLDEDLERYRL